MVHAMSLCPHDCVFVCGFKNRARIPFAKVKMSFKKLEVMFQMCMFSNISSHTVVLKSLLLQQGCPTYTGWFEFLCQGPSNGLLYFHSANVRLDRYHGRACVVNIHAGS